MVAGEFFNSISVPTPGSAPHVESSLHDRGPLAHTAQSEVSRWRLPLDRDGIDS